MHPNWMGKKFKLAEVKKILKMVQKAPEGTEENSPETGNTALTQPERKILRQRNLAKLIL